MMSNAPLGAAGTITRTGRVGYACAQAKREAVGSAAAHAARCRKFRRGRFILNLASHHSITSSASGSSLSGICRASAFLVFWLVVKSIFVAFFLRTPAGPFHLAVA